MLFLSLSRINDNHLTPIWEQIIFMSLVSCYCLLKRIEIKRIESNIMATWVLQFNLLLEKRDKVFYTWKRELENIKISEKSSILYISSRNPKSWSSLCVSLIWVFKLHTWFDSVKNKDHVLVILIFKSSLFRK